MLPGVHVEGNRPGAVALSADDYRARSVPAMYAVGLALSRLTWLECRVRLLPGCRAARRSLAIPPGHTVAHAH